MRRFWNVTIWSGSGATEILGVAYLHLVKASPRCRRDAVSQHVSLKFTDVETRSTCIRSDARPSTYREDATRVRFILAYVVRHHTWRFQPATGTSGIEYAFLRLLVPRSAHCVYVIWTVYVYHQYVSDANAIVRCNENLTGEALSPRGRGLKTNVKIESLCPIDSDPPNHRAPNVLPVSLFVVAADEKHTRRRRENTNGNEVPFPTATECEIYEHISLHVDDTNSRHGEPIDTAGAVQLGRARTLPTPTTLTFPFTIDFPLYGCAISTTQKRHAALPFERFHMRFWLMTRSILTYLETRITRVTKRPAGEIMVYVSVASALWVQRVEPALLHKKLQTNNISHSVSCKFVDFCCAIGFYNFALLGKSLVLVNFTNIQCTMNY